MARRILSGSQFHASPGKQFAPFKGFFDTLGRWLHRAWDDTLGKLGVWAGERFDSLVRLIGWIPTLIIIGLVVITVIGLVATRIARRVPRLGLEPAAGGDQARPEDPRRLEAEADAAEAAGNLELAVRLRFKAGLLRLERQGLLAGRDVLTAAEIAETLRSPSFRKLAADLEEILYAEEPARSTHAESSRELWPRVQPEASANR